MSSYGKIKDVNSIIGSSLFNTIFLNKNAKRDEIIYSNFIVDGGTIKFDNLVGTTPNDTNNILTLNSNNNIAISNVKLNEFAETSDLSFLDNLLDTSTTTDFNFLIKTGSNLRYYNPKKYINYLTLGGTQTITGQKTILDIRHSNPSTSNRTDLKLGIIDNNNTLRPATQTIFDIEPEPAEPSEPSEPDAPDPVGTPVIDLPVAETYDHGALFYGQFDIRAYRSGADKKLGEYQYYYSNPTLYEPITDLTTTDNKNAFHFKPLPEGWYEAVLIYHHSSFQRPHRSDSRNRMGCAIDGQYIDYVDMPLEFCYPDQWPSRRIAKGVFYFNSTGNSMGMCLRGGSWGYNAFVLVRRLF